jgi:hypothetical protein
MLPFVLWQDNTCTGRSVQHLEKNIVAGNRLSELDQRLSDPEESGKYHYYLVGNYQKTAFSVKW